MAGMKHGELLYRFSTMPPEKSNLVPGEVRKHRQFGSCLNGGAGRPWPASRTSLSGTAVRFLTATLSGKSCTTPHHMSRPFPEPTVEEKAKSPRRKALNIKEILFPRDLLV